MRRPLTSQNTVGLLRPFLIQVESFLILYFPNGFLQYFSFMDSSHSATPVLIQWTHVHNTTPLPDKQLVLKLLGDGQGSSPS